MDLLGQLWICSVSGSFGQTIPAALSYKVAAIAQIWVEHFIPRTRVRITLSLLFVIASRIAPGLGHGMFVKKKETDTINYTPVLQRIRSCVTHSLVMPAVMRALHLSAA